MSAGVSIGHQREVYKDQGYTDAEAWDLATGKYTIHTLPRNVEKKVSQRNMKIRNNLTQDFDIGSTFGREMVPEGSLGRIGTDSDIKAVIEARRGLAGGLTGEAMQAQRDAATQQINMGVESARRRMQAAQARSGVRGATAGSQIGQILSQGINQRRQFEQNLLANQFEAQRAGVSDLESTVRGVREFDLGQAARERFTELQTGLSFGQLGAIERGSLAAAQATTEAARLSRPRSSGGLLGGIFGGGSVICTELHRQGYISNEQWKLNQAFGKMVGPVVMMGYLTWAAPLVKLMKVSSTFSKLMAFIFKPWSKSMAYEMSGKEEYKPSKYGDFMKKATVSFSRKLGKALLYFKKQVA